MKIDIVLLGLILTGILAFYIVINRVDFNDDGFKPQPMSNSSRFLIEKIEHQ
jgi:hypothetical protein